MTIGEAIEILAEFDDETEVTVCTSSAEIKEGDIATVRIIKDVFSANIDGKQVAVFVAKETFKPFSKN